jgi:hypothetical protein
LGAVIMGTISEEEDKWLAKATEAAVAGARKVALADGPTMNTPVGRLNARQWGMIVCAIIFGWTDVKSQQAIAEGLSTEDLMRVTGLVPDPCDVAVIRSILPTLADGSAIDWSQPLGTWTPDMMTNFLLSAWRLIRVAETARDHGPGHILKKAEVDWETGDPLPPF